MRVEEYICLPGSVLKEALYPVNLASYSDGSHHDLFPAGMNSIRLVVQVGQNAVQETRDFVMRDIEVRKRPSPYDAAIDHGAHPLP